MCRRDRRQPQTAGEPLGTGTAQSCGTVLNGPLSVPNTRDHLTLTGPGCTPNSLNGPTQPAGNPS